MSSTGFRANADVVRASVKGRQLLNDPELNKGTAFSREERTAFGLHGLLPARIETLTEQVLAARDRYDSFPTDLQRHVYLRALEDTNEVLFYAFLDRYLTEILPIIYTPTVGDACEQFSHIYRRPHGLFLSYPERDCLEEQLASIEGDIDVAVVTDGERILGLGDQGLGGMGIPIGKLSLYTAAGGIDPRRSLPILLDVGTNNQSLLDDPMYLGWRHERITGADYDDFVDQVVTVLNERFPSLLLQWEDFGGQHAATLLDRYRHEILSFNDDIQGTAVVALATIRSAVARTEMPLSEHRICLVGAGSAGCGIAGMLTDALEREGGCGRDQVFLIDADGLVHDGRNNLTKEQQALATPRRVIDSWDRDARLDDLNSVVDAVGPTILVGVSGQGGLFSEQMIRGMAATTARPVILPLSNPTSRAEATPEDLLAWTSGRALIATGSPFPEITFEGRPHTISQANNVYVFPGLGLGALVAQPTHISNRMLSAAAEALSSEALKFGDGLLPPIADVKRISRVIAGAVVRAAVDEGIADPIAADDVDVLIEQRFFEPRYPQLRSASSVGATTRPPLTSASQHV